MRIKAEYLVSPDLKSEKFRKDDTNDTFSTLKEAREQKSKKGTRYFIYKLKEIGNDGIPYWVKVK